MKTAFLHGQLEEDLYMRQPEGFAYQMDQVCRLNCSIYGLKQSSICWFQCLTDFLDETGMKASCANPCMYFLEQKQNEEDDLVLCFHVDDGLLMGVETLHDVFLQMSSERFGVTDSEVDNYLGM